MSDGRESYVFYRSFYEAISDIDNPLDRLALHEAIAAYSLDGVIPELTGLPRTLWRLMEPNLAANNKRYKDGNKGGRPKKKPKETTGSEEKKPLVILDNNHSSETQETTGFEKNKPNKDKDKDVDKDKDKEEKKTKAKKIQTLKPDYENDFFVFWKEYPEKKAKPHALKAFEKARKKASLTEIMDGLNEYIRCKPPNISFAHPASWLNAERWTDKYNPQSNGDMRKITPKLSKVDEIAQQINEIKSRDSGVGHAANREGGGNTGRFPAGTANLWENNR